MSNEKELPTPDYFAKKLISDEYVDEITKAYTELWTRNEELTRQLAEWEELEGKLCPEDFGFEEYIISLRKQLAEAREALKTFQNLAELNANHVVALREKELTGVCGCQCHTLPVEIRDCDLCFCWKKVNR